MFTTFAFVVMEKPYISCCFAFSPSTLRLFKILFISKGTDTELIFTKLYLIKLEVSCN